MSYTCHCDLEKDVLLLSNDLAPGLNVWINLFRYAIQLIRTVLSIVHSSLDELLKRPF